ncbi:MAG: rhodanese-like domain-containing protein [Acidimicrobiia bacterium]|nr:rhodanese-like domain-containing protein [Acidimicrobiia bacterium]
MDDSIPSLAEYLAAARARLDRVRPEDLTRELESGTVVIDVRDSAQRERDGEIPGAIPIDLTVLEWRLAPSSEWHSMDIGPDQRVILVCSQGFSSSLAAARLQDLGLRGATDVEGGFFAWRGDAAP